MTWEILEYETAREGRPVAEFIKIQRPQAIAKITQLIDLLAKHGPFLGMPHAKKIGANIYELRLRGKEEIRIVYGFKKKNIYLLHCFKKQGNKTPKKEIDTALKRYMSLT